VTPRRRPWIAFAGRKFGESERPAYGLGVFDYYLEIADTWLLFPSTIVCKPSSRSMGVREGGRVVGEKRLGVSQLEGLDIRPAPLAILA
jgi:hypothetical protein